MNIKEYLAILSLLLGFESSIFFVAGVLLLRPKTIAKMSACRPGMNPHLAIGFLSQRADFVSGGVALGLSFILQIILQLPISYFITTMAAPSYLCGIVSASLLALASFLLLIGLDILLRTLATPEKALQALKSEIKNKQ